jgi:glycosyltransferase involved in cell wall biosynthesis
VKLPGVPFLVYGSKMPESFKALEADDVILKGYAESTGEVYDKARVFVAPLLTGAGLKGKVIGAFARGIPSVLTPTAAEGTGANHGQSAMICSGAEKWATQIAELYTNKNSWKSMSDASRFLAESRYSFACGQEKITNALHQVGLFPDDSQQSIWQVTVGV